MCCCETCRVRTKHLEAEAWLQYTTEQSEGRREAEPSKRSIDYFPNIFCGHYATTGSINEPCCAALAQRQRQTGDPGWASRDQTLLVAVLHLVYRTGVCESQKADKEAETS